MVAHCAGMIDLIALPVWIGVLITHYRFDPQQAGAMITSFLISVVLASLVVAPRFQRLPTRPVAVIGFAVAATGFGLASQTADFYSLALLHALCGLGVGAALSVTHGTVARSERPHRLFAIVGIALGVFAVVFFGVAPQLIAANSGAVLFVIFSLVMVIAALAALLAFPSPAKSTAVEAHATRAPLPAAVWAGIGGIACMALVQAMTFGFLEQVGIDHGFARQDVNGVLIALGLVNLLPAALAALLEKRWLARNVLLAAPLLQAALCLLVMTSSSFLPYAMAASVFAAVLIFSHTFAFGLIAKLDVTGRALAATPAMVMTGAAIGPVLAGTLVKAFGYTSLAQIAVLIAAVAAFLFSRLPSGATPISAKDVTV